MCDNKECAKDIATQGIYTTNIPIVSSDTSGILASVESATNTDHSGHVHHRSKRKKLEIACVYCRRSHMICDETRPCQRCIKRGISHLCYDEPSNPRQRKMIGLSQVSSQTASPESQNGAQSFTANDAIAPISSNIRVSPTSDDSAVSYINNHGGIKSEDKNSRWDIGTNSNAHTVDNYNPILGSSVLAHTLPYNQDPLFYSEHAGSEFSSLNEFLSLIDDPELVNSALIQNASNKSNAIRFGMNQPIDPPNISPEFTGCGKFVSQPPSGQDLHQMPPSTNIINPDLPSEVDQTRIPFIAVRTDLNTGIQPDLQDQTSQNHQPVISDAARDKFFLTAADPTTEISPEERLKQVIKAKLEAGLLQPYNYAKGYARLQVYMENYMNTSSRQRILKPLTIFRPAFRAIARTLKDVDLVLVEESFERMLLDYDRVFTSMAIPACLWRRTGEIYRGNKEFASLVGVVTDDLKEGKLAIYELMSEESAVNFWEKYGAIAFDKGQKAVLTSCNLRTKSGTRRKTCCFSFTIRRDRYNIPTCIVGNFIPIDH